MAYIELAFVAPYIASDKKIHRIMRKYPTSFKVDFVILLEIMRTKILKYAIFNTVISNIADERSKQNRKRLAKYANQKKSIITAYKISS